jgi:hypothetical protein
MMEKKKSNKKKIKKFNLKNFGLKARLSCFFSFTYIKTRVGLYKLKELNHKDEKKQ